MCCGWPVSRRRSPATAACCASISAAAGVCSSPALKGGPMGWLDGQVALVTGGGSGIGRAVVARYLEECACVAVMERVATRADQMRAEFGDKVIGITGDVARLDDNKRAVAETVRA